MNNKEYGGDLCKNHSARSEKEFCRVCPSNLNKKELENVYFTLLENNLNLKTTINSQHEKIKILSTKVQRLTALQKTYLGKEPKECCGSKALIDEQKECISELRRSNHSLSERVRQLNMRLCSAKQFLKKSPFQSTSRCNRCSNKNISMSALMSKRSETNLRTTAASSQYLVKDILSSRTVDNTVSHEKGVQYDFCDENKCRDRIEELTKKNDELQEELLRLKEKHAAVASQLESDVSELRAESVRVRSERTLAEERAEQLRTQLAEVTGRLGSADLRCDELSVELAVEQRRVCELETRLRAADMSTRIADVIHTHLSHIQVAKDPTNAIRDMEAGVHTKPATDDSNLLSVPSPLVTPKAAVRTKIPHNVQVEEVFKSSDDSGYTEVNRSQEFDDTRASTTINQMLLEKIADLQNQINNLKAFKNNYNTPNESINVTQDINIENTDTSRARPDKQQSEENVISESSESVITEKQVNMNITETKQNESDKNDNKPKIKSGNEVSKQTPTYREYKDSKFKEQQSETNVDTKSRENFETFKRRIKDTSNENKTLTDRRKLSLQSSRESLKEKNIIKTGSFDETRIANVNTTKILTAGVTTMKNVNKSQISNSNNEISNTGGSERSGQNIIYERESNIQSQNKTKDKNQETNVTDTKDKKRKDSDSSNGTYTIHKDENVPKLKIESNDTRAHKTEENKNYKAPWTLAADVKRVLNSASNDKLVHRRRSTTSEPRTYVQVPRDVSPDSTECEISSMSDLPSERDERAVYIRSPGEERSRTTTTATPTTTDYGSLSEGELPYLRDATILSDGEKRLSDRMGKSHSLPVCRAPDMEATLAAVQRELSRCTQLLQARPHSLDPPA